MPNGYSLTSGEMQYAEWLLSDKSDANREKEKNISLRVFKRKGKKEELFPGKMKEDKSLFRRQRALSERRQRVTVLRQKLGAYIVGKFSFRHLRAFAGIYMYSKIFIKDLLSVPKMCLGQIAIKHTNKALFSTTQNLDSKLWSNCLRLNKKNQTTTSLFDSAYRVNIATLRIL